MGKVRYNAAGDALKIAYDRYKEGDVKGALLVMSSAFELDGMSDLVEGIEEVNASAFEDEDMVKDFDREKTPSDDETTDDEKEGQKEGEEDADFIDDEKLFPDSDVEGDDDFALSSMIDTIIAENEAELEDEDELEENEDDELYEDDEDEDESEDDESEEDESEDEGLFEVESSDEEDEDESEDDDDSDEEPEEDEEDSEGDEEDEEDDEDVDMDEESPIESGMKKCCASSTFLEHVAVANKASLSGDKGARILGKNLLRSVK